MTDTTGDKVAEIAEAARDRALREFQNWQDADEKAKSAAPLIDRFFDDFGVFDNYFNDSITDAKAIDRKCLKAEMCCIRITRKHIMARGRRGDFLAMGESVLELGERYQALGKLLYEVIETYMTSISEKSDDE